MSVKRERVPQTNTEFWREKIVRNQARDGEVRKKLRALGWRTMVVWKCQLKSKTRQKTLEEIVFLLNGVFLDKYRRKNYRQEESELSIAAEGEVGMERLIKIINKKLE